MILGNHGGELAQLVGLLAGLLPAVQLAQLRLGLQVPQIALSFGVHYGSEIPPYAKVVSSKKTENVGDRCIAPRKVERGGP